MARRSPRWVRLAASVESLRADLVEAQRRLTPEVPPADRAAQARQRLAVRKAWDLYRHAAQAVEDGDVSTGWLMVHRAREAWVWSLDGPELDLEASDLARKATALGSRKGGMVQDWLEPASFGALDVHHRRARVARAMQVRNEHWDVYYQSGRLMQGRLTWFAAMMLVGAAAAVVSLALMEPDEVPEMVGGIDFPLAVASFGFLGGSFTATLSTVRGVQQSVLPEQIRDAPWQFIRPLLGAASALVVVLGAAAGYFPTTKELTQEYLVLATAAGFSESLLVRLMGRMGASSKRDPAPGPDAPATRSSKPSPGRTPAPALRVDASESQAS